MAPLSSFCIELPALYSKTSKREQLLPKCLMQLLLISFHPYALALLETKPDTHFSLYCTAPLETGFFIIDILQITLNDSRHITFSQAEKEPRGWTTLPHSFARNVPATRSNPVTFCTAILDQKRALLLVALPIKAS